MAERFRARRSQRQNGGVFGCFLVHSHIGLLQLSILGLTLIHWFTKQCLSPRIPLHLRSLIRHSRIILNGFTVPYTSCENKNNRFNCCLACPRHRSTGASHHTVSGFLNWCSGSSTKQRPHNWAGTFHAR